MMRKDTGPEQADQNYSIDGYVSLKRCGIFYKVFFSLVIFFLFLQRDREDSFSEFVAREFNDHILLHAIMVRLPPLIRK